MTYKRANLTISVDEISHPQPPTDTPANTDTAGNPQTPLYTNQDPFANTLLYGNHSKHKNMPFNLELLANQTQLSSDRNSISRTDSTPSINPAFQVETPLTPTFATLNYPPLGVASNLSTTSLSSLMSLDGPPSALNQELDSDMDMYWKPAHDEILLSVFYSIRDDPTTAPWAGAVPPSGIVGKVARECVKHGTSLQQNHQQSFDKNAGFYDAEPFIWNHSMSGCRKRLIKLCNNSAKPNRYKGLTPNYNFTNNPNNKLNHGKIRRGSNVCTADLDVPHAGNGSIVSNGIIPGGGISMNRSFSASSCSSITSSIPDTPTLTGFGNASFVNRNFSGLSLAANGISATNKNSGANAEDFNSLDKGLLASPGLHDSTYNGINNIENWLITNSDKVGGSSPGTQTGILTEGDSVSDYFNDEFVLVPPPSLRSHSIHLLGDKQNPNNSKINNHKSTDRIEKYDATTPPPPSTFGDISSPNLALSSLSLEENNHNNTNKDCDTGTHYTPPPVILHHKSVKDGVSKEGESLKSNSPTARRQYNGHYTIYYNNSTTNSEADLEKTQKPVLAQLAVPLAPPAPIPMSNRTKNSGNLSFSPVNSKHPHLPLGVGGFIFDDRSLKSPFSEIHPDSNFSQPPASPLNTAMAVTTTSATGTTMAALSALNGEIDLGNTPANIGGNTNSSNNTEANIMNWRKRESLRLKRGLA
ncbi:hypothetical protein NADFUDRAFT_42109 [Nadsonia fulvescens var. elongata DSM 6958]|uniref:Uncharacterized protein n=1 Tax=Nadsonia fulvescens var. elongata DSM 6958 TaxID=857566 RepID=A0A1E3PMS2_9ASCO|nr:hypothetical protein NADFUDRAFT_42109 [Nadsonia fulvescens var. elongata DSM 6958]